MAKRLDYQPLFTHGSAKGTKYGGCQAKSLQDGLKRCSKCREFLVLDDFPFNKRGVAERNSWCKECYAQYHKDRKLERKFNLTRSAFDKLVESQNGACAICRQEVDNLHVDHDHSTGAVRGLLCINCNFALGFFKDDLVVMRQALSYLNSQEE